MADTQPNAEEVSVTRDDCELIVMVKRGADGRLYRVGGPQMPKVGELQSTACVGKTSSALSPQSDTVEAETTASAQQDHHLTAETGQCAEPNCPYADVEYLVWIQCDACYKWFHCVCISGYNVNVAPNWKYFFCSCFRPEGCP